MLRCTVFAALFAPAVLAQFSGLSTTTDGSSLYFSTTLRLKGGEPLLNGKIFVASQGGVKLIRSQPVTPAPASTPACGAGGFAEYSGAETSAAGTIALFYRGNAGDRPCSAPINTNITQIVTSAGSTNMPGIARLSAGGRYAIIFAAATARTSDPVSISFLDLTTNVQTPTKTFAPTFPNSFLTPRAVGRVIANDGTAILGVTDGVNQAGYLLKPGGDPTPFPVQGGLPLLIDASGSKVVYLEQGVRLFDLKSLTSTLLMPAAGDPSFDFRMSMSDDAGRLLFIRNGQAHVVDTATLSDRALTNDPAQIVESTISGDGKVVYAVTQRGRLLRINADDGTTIERIGHTPYLYSTGLSIIPGLAATVGGSGLADAEINGTPPLLPFLGSVTMWIGERKVPMVQITPTSVRFLVPWDIVGPVRILAEVPGENTPFYFPEVQSIAIPGAPQAGAIARQDWTQTFVGPVNTGEIIHIRAIGFGPVAPEIPEGAVAPSVEPLPRITQSLACSNAEVLYAGLAPGTVERIYQIDLRIGPTAGYQKFLCTLGGSTPFNFLTLNVTPGQE